MQLTRQNVFTFKQLLKLALLACHQRSASGVTRGPHVAVCHEYGLDYVLSVSFQGTLGNETVLELLLVDGILREVIDRSQDLAAIRKQVVDAYRVRPPTSLTAEQVRSAIEETFEGSYQYVPRL